MTVHFTDLLFCLADIDCRVDSNNIFSPKSKTSDHRCDGREEAEDSIEQLRFVDEAAFDDRQLLPDRLQQEGEDGGLAFEVGLVGGCRKFPDVLNRLFRLLRDQREMGQRIEPTPAQIETSFKH